MKSRGPRGFRIRQQCPEWTTGSVGNFQGKQDEGTANRAVGRELPVPLFDRELAQRLMPEARRGSSDFSDSVL
jgi:hypothetical protein